jgi:Protein of unknown function (DUF3995)
MRSFDLGRPALTGSGCPRSLTQVAKTVDGSAGLRAGGMIGGVAMSASPLTRAAGYAAAAVALLYAVVSVYWALGGQALLSTVGGWVEDLGRRGGAASAAVGLLAAGLKLAGALLALVLVHPAGRRLPQRLLWGLAAAVSGVLVLYGGVLVVVGALVLTGVISPAGPVDRAALRWHVLVWDSWFLLWGLLLGLTVLSGRRDAHQTANA